MIDLSGEKVDMRVDCGSLLTIGVFWCIFRLGVFHSAVVVHENEGVFVLGIMIALCSFVTGTEIALERYKQRAIATDLTCTYSWVIFWEGGFRSCFLLTSGMTVSICL